MRKLNKRGFTIVELMIATLVFSTVLLVCAAGLIRIGQFYTKGVIRSRTQESARNAIDTISQTLQMTNGTLTSADYGFEKAYCIGNQRFSYRINEKLDDGAPGNVLVAHPATKPCGPDVANAAGMSSGNPGGQELLGPNMQLAALNIVDNGDTYAVSIRVVYGDDDFFTGNDINQQCLNEAGFEFCTTVDLSTTVQKRI